MAARNAARHGVAERIEFHQGDLLAPLPDEPRWDFIVSNPPYVSEPEYAELPDDVRQYEPRKALVGGPGGVETIARLIPQAASRLRPGGWLLLEISPMIEPAVRSLLGAEARFGEPKVTKDLAGLARVIRVERRDD